MKAAASTVRGSVTARRLRTRRPTATSYWIDRPRSPRSAPPSHSTYWTGMGRSRPIACRSAAAASGLASVPMMRRAGSPGSTRTTVNTTRETTKRVARNATARRRISRRTGRSAPRPPETAALLRPAHLRQVHGRRGQVLPDALDALLGRHQARVYVEPDGRRFVRHDFLELGVEVAALLVVERRLGLLEHRLEARAVVPEVVLRVGVVPGVPGLGVPDDRHVVVGVLVDALEPLPPLDLLELHPDPHLRQLLD